MTADSVASEVLFRKPYPAFRVKGHVFRETVYGIIRRLSFLLNHIEAERHRRNLQVGQMRILDVGCGTGINISIPLASIGYSVLGLDIDSASIARAQEISADIPTVEFRCCYLEQASLASRFHIVICSEVFEHLKQPAVLLKQLRDILEENGVLLITVPNGYGYFELEHSLEESFPNLNRITDQFQHRFIARHASESIRQRHEKEWCPDHYQLAWTSLSPDQEHYQRSTPREMRRLLREQRFEMIEFRNRTFLAGNILSNLVRDWDWFLEWNGTAADYLPHWLCSGWMIAARR
jgi:2-polyprenyl-3-methyl-5-hydroxy-6-metoxy-1,4-benzoquinol methylase